MVIERLPFEQCLGLECAQRGAADGAEEDAGFKGVIPTEAGCSLAKADLKRVTGTPCACPRHSLALREVLRQEIGHLNLVIRCSERRYTFIIAVADDRAV